MTEYDYSPEAREAYDRKLRQIDRWRHELTRYQPANPFKPIPDERPDSDDESQDEDEDYVRVDAPSPTSGDFSESQQPFRTSHRHRHRSTRVKKESRSRKRSHSSAQRPPLVPYNSSTPALGVYPTPGYGPPVLQRGLSSHQQYYPATTLTPPQGTGTRSYSSPITNYHIPTSLDAAAYQQTAMQQQQQQQYHPHRHHQRYTSRNNIYAPPPAPPPPTSPNQLQYIKPPYPRSSSSSYTLASPPLYPNQAPSPFGVQLKNGMASQSTTALSNTTTLLNPGSPTFCHPSYQHQHQQQAYYPQALPGGGMIYVGHPYYQPQSSSSPTPSAVPVPMMGVVPGMTSPQLVGRGGVVPPGYWSEATGAYCVPTPSPNPTPTPAPEKRKGFLGGLLRMGSRKSKASSASRT